MAAYLIKQGISAEAIAAGNQTGRVVVHVPTTETLVIAGNNSVSNVAVGIENVASAVITKIFYSGNTTVTRGANTVFSASTGASGVWDLNAADITLSQFPAANIVVTIGTGGGPAIIELRKKLV